MRLKVEINSREHFAVFGFKKVSYAVASRWFEGSCEIASYELDELLATKLRALYQRSQGRDLFDLATSLHHPEATPVRIIKAFSAYVESAGQRVTRAQFEQNLDAKLRDPQFAADIGPLLTTGYTWDPVAAARLVSSSLIELLPGAPWKGER
jgi:predicted nucleotidyltransferase component of viral defense system